MTTFVRVCDNSAGTEITVSNRRAKQLAERSDKIEILEGMEAVDALGRPLPPSKVKAAQSAGKSKEQSR